MTFKDLNDSEIFKDVDMNSLQLGSDWDVGDVKALKHYMDMELEPELMLGPLGVPPREWDCDIANPTPGELMDMLRPHLCAPGEAVPNPVTLGELMPSLKVADLSLLLEAARVPARQILLKLKKAEAVSASSSSSSSDDEASGSASSSSSSSDSSTSDSDEDQPAATTSVEEVEDGVAVGLLAALASAKSAGDQVRTLLMWTDMQHVDAVKMEDEMDADEAEWLKATMATAKEDFLQIATTAFAGYAKEEAATAGADMAKMSGADVTTTAGAHVAKTSDAEVEQVDELDKVGELRGVLSQLNREPDKKTTLGEREVYWELGKLYHTSAGSSNLTSAEFDELKTHIEAKWVDWELEWEDTQAKKGGSIYKNVKEEEAMMNKVAASVKMDAATEKFVQMANMTIQAQATWSYATKQKALASIMERI